MAIEERSYKGQAQVAADDDFKAIFERFIVRESDVSFRLNATDYHDGAKWFVDALITRHNGSYQPCAVEMVFSASNETCPAVVRFLELTSTSESCSFVMQFIQDSNPQWTYTLTATLLPFSVNGE
jgi:hypothetical protein